MGRRNARRGMRGGWSTRAGACALLSASSACTAILGAQDPIETFGDVGAEGGTGLPPYRSGSRLRARLAEVDGVALFLGWHDRNLDIDCTFELADDGVTRCLPSGSGLAPIDGYYADSSCSLPVTSVPASSGCPSARLAVGSSSSGSCEQSVWSVGAPMASGGLVYTRGSSGACGLITSPPANIASLTPMAASAFVGAKPSARTSRGPDLAMRWLVADDGSVQADALFDTVRNVRCGPTIVPGSFFVDFPGRCAPQDLAWVIDTYVDPACTKLAALSEYTPGTGCQPPPVAVVDDPGTGSPYDTTLCSPPAPWLAEIGPVASSTLYGNNYGGSACTAQTGGGSTLSYQVGARIDIATLPSLAPRDDGSGRVRAHTLTSSVGTPLFASTLFDTQLGATCLPTQGEDAIWRCMPSEAPGTLFYADAGCSAALLQYRHGCAPPELVESTVSLGVACSAEYGTIIFRTGARETPTTVYSGSPGYCNASAASGEYDYYAATVVDPSTFEAMTLVTE